MSAQNEVSRSSALVVGNTTVDLRLITPRPLQEKDGHLLLPVGGKIPVQVEATIGGNAANVAVSLGRQGVDVTLFTFTARHCDSTAIIENAFRREGIPVIEDVDESEGGQNPTSVVIPSAHDRTIFSGKPVRANTFSGEKVAHLAPPQCVYLTSIGDP